MESQASNTPLRRSVSLPKIASKVPLSKTRSCSCILEIIVDFSIFSPYNPLAEEGFQSKYSSIVSKLKSLVNKVQETTEETILSQKIVPSQVSSSYDYVFISF